MASGPTGKCRLGARGRGLYRPLFACFLTQTPKPTAGQSVWHCHVHLILAGVGGMREAFDIHGCQCVLTCEINDDAMLTYKENYRPHHEHSYFKDVFDLTVKNIPPYNILIAGFPCQPFSIAGLRKGLKDKRGEVFSAIIRILKETKPDAFLLENVKGIVNHDKGEKFIGSVAEEDENLD
ncbi:MAG: DNA (cytosine-5-)-methyltransferase [Nitrosomonadaceae bacterium]|nr:DNA (cytosine-5-)-methyltransferase [Nitrosomonadaceae bacterium]